MKSKIAIYFAIPIVLGIILVLPSAVSQAAQGYSLVDRKNQLWQTVASVEYNGMIVGKGENAILSRPKDAGATESKYPGDVVAAQDEAAAPCDNIIDTNLISSFTAYSAPSQSADKRSRAGWLAGDNGQRTGLNRINKSWVTNSDGQCIGAAYSLAWVNPAILIFGDVLAGSNLSGGKIDFGSLGSATAGAGIGRSSARYNIPGYKIDDKALLKWTNDEGVKKLNEAISNLSGDAKNIPTGNIFNSRFYLNTNSSNYWVSNGEWRSGGGVWRISASGTTVFNAVSGDGTKFSQVGTIIAPKDVTIAKNLVYHSDCNSQPCSLAIVALDGDVRIGSGVSQVEAIIYAPKGKIIIEEGGEQPLTMKGAFIAKDFILNQREGQSSETDIAGYKTEIIYDSRYLSYPPPGFNKGLGDLLGAEPAVP